MTDLEIYRAFLRRQRANYLHSPEGLNGHDAYLRENGIDPSSLYDKPVTLASPSFASTRFMDSIYREVVKKEADMVDQIVREACELFRCGPEDLARSFEGGKLILYGPQHEDDSPRLVIARVWVDAEGQSIAIKVEKAKGLGEC